MFGRATVVECLLLVGELEKELEMMRQTLDESQKMHAARELFFSLAKMSTRSIVFEDLERLMKRYAASYDDGALMMVFKCMDANKDGVVDEQEFEEYLRPREQRYEKSRNTRIDICLCLFKLIDGELRSIDRLEKAKKTFSMQTGKLQLRSIFESIDAQSQAEIKPQSLQLFLKQEGKYPTLQMCDRIVRYCCRYSARNRFDFEAFTYCMLPKILTGVSSARNKRTCDENFELLNPSEQGKRIYTWTNDSSNQSTEPSDSFKRAIYRDSNLSVRSYFSHLVACIRQLEDKRTDLAMRDDFCIDDLYAMMDFTRRGILKQEDFQRFFQSTLDDGLAVRVSEVASLVGYYDKDQDGCISLEEFSSMFVPFDITFKTILQKRQTRRVKYWDQFNLRTRKAIRDLFRTLLSLEHSLATTAASLTEEETKETFRIIDRKNLGKVDVKRIMVSLLSMGVSVTYDDIVGMVERLDMNEDMRVSYDEFMRELSPGTLDRPSRR